MENNKGNIEIDLRRAVFALWNRAWVVILAGVICAVATFSYAYFFISPTYESKVKIYVNNHYTENAGYSPSQLTAAQDLADTYMVILKSRSVLDKVAEKAALGYSSGSLNGMISAVSINNTEVFEVKVTCTDYKHAAIIANAVADVLPDRISEIVEGSSVRVVDRALENPSPIGPSYSKYIFMGVAIGVICSSILVVLVDVMDTTINSEEYITHAYKRCPLLAVIPGANDPNANYRKGYRGYYRGYYQMKAKRKSAPEMGGGEEN